MTTSSRREARERAVELLYESESKSTHPSTVMAELPLPVEEYAAALANGVADHVDEIDETLRRYAERWDPKRMAVMDRTVLRLGLYELALEPGVPTGAVLNEAVELGTQYGSTDDTGKFVNGILANIAKEVRDGGDRPWLPIDTVVFDMDGVIRHWTDARVKKLEADLGRDDLGLEMARIAFLPELYTPAMTGELTMADWAAEIGRRTAASLAPNPVPVDGDTDDPAEFDAESLAAAVEQSWLESSWSIDDEVVAMVRAVKDSGVRVALFSNASSNLEADLDRIGITDLFDVVANSSRLGDLKPSVSAFDTVHELVGGDKTKTLFIDDTQANVVGAVHAGWHAIRMIDTSRLRATLQRVGVLTS